MNVARSLAEVEAVPSAVTVGNFDGVHRGHRTLVHRTIDTALRRGLRSVVLTFDPHPAAVLRPGSEPPRLQSLEQRLETLADLGVDLTLILAFTPELAALSADGFVSQVLAEGVGAAAVVVGTDFRYGHRAAGDIVHLSTAGERHGFVVEAVGLLALDGDQVSSSAIRRAVADGEIEAAARGLGRPFALRGEVVEGDGRGRTIGVPTANLAVDASVVVPADGVYAGRVKLDDRWYPAVTNVGRRPTFQGTGTTVETHLLDAEVGLYGRVIEVT
ncbi:MAG: bifunctional riboflavin kinase/FAD synthetase, partial [Nitriliruptoraceae bacterium]